MVVVTNVMVKRSGLKVYLEDFLIISRYSLTPTARVSVHVSKITLSLIGLLL